MNNESEYDDEDDEDYTEARLQKVEGRDKKEPWTATDISATVSDTEEEENAENDEDYAEARAQRVDEKRDSFSACMLAAQALHMSKVFVKRIGEGGPKRGNGFDYGKII